MKNHKKKTNHWNSSIAIIFFVYFSLSSLEMVHIFETEEVTLHNPKEANKYYFSLLPGSITKEILIHFLDEFKRSNNPAFSLKFKIEKLLKENKISDAAFWGSFNITIYENELFNEGFGEGNIAIAQLYLARNKNPSAPRAEYGIPLSPLHLALYAKRSQVACMLIEMGADPNETDDGSTYPICQAAANNDVLCVRLLLEKGANKNLERALQWAARNNSTEVVRLLLEAGADPNTVDSGRSAFEEAADNQNALMAHILVANGAVINPKSYLLRYALQRALDKKNGLTLILQNAGVELP